jgi:predicted transposase/invertase (TIGR01784 family)
LKQEKRNGAIIWLGNVGLGRKADRKEGKKEGRKEGESRKAIEIAKNALHMKLPVPDIAELTGLSAEEIMGLGLN